MKEARSSPEENERFKEMQRAKAMLSPEQARLSYARAEDIKFEKKIKAVANDLILNPPEKAVEGEVLSFSGTFGKHFISLRLHSSVGREEFSGTMDGRDLPDWEAERLWEEFYPIARECSNRRKWDKKYQK